MKYTIDKNSTEHAYMQIYRQLRGDIVSGLLPQGSKLPSKRLLADALGVSLITVEHAYALLTDEGYAAARERSGYFVSFGGRTQPEATLAPSVKMSEAVVSAPEDFPFSVFARTMRRVLTDYDRRILVKAPPQGCAELRQALAEYLARSRGISVSPEQIVVGSGAEHLYSQIVQLLGREKLYALEDPGWQRIRQVYEANGAQCLPLSMGEDGIISAALEACPAAVLHVTPFNSYPSGVTASAAKRHEYARWAKEHGGIIIEDDYDAEFSSGTKHIETIFSIAPEHVIYVNTFTKTLAPAMRTAYMVLPAALAETYREKLGFYSCSVPVFEQLVLAEFIATGELERCINRRRRKMRK